MTQEEKAKAYDEALKVLHKYDGANIMFSQSLKEEMFPELKESEDKKMKEQIIYAINQLHVCECTKNKLIVWFKKQGEQNNNEDADILQRFSFYSYKDEPNILYLSGLYVNEECRNKGIGTKILEVADEVAKSLNCNAIRLKTKKDSNAERLYRTHGYNSLQIEERDEIWFEKQGKQKSIDEIAKEVSKDKTSAIAFLKASGIMNENGELAEQYRQSEQNPADKIEPKFKVKYAGSEYNVLVVKDIAGVTFYGIEDEPNHIDYVLPNNCEIVSEQKLADKVEPKFKVGQTIIYKGTENIAPTKMTISDIANGQYWDDNCCIVPISDQDNWELVEQKPAFEMKTPEESLGIDSDTYSKVVNECIYGEQKPTDKVETKFYEGEWITNGDYTWKVVEVKPLDYILQSQDGNIVDDTISHVDEQFHSFTIEDAKDGDVLFTSSTASHETFIFKSIDENGNIECYFAYDSEDGFREGKYHFIGKPTFMTYPATREQRDLLFQKMRESGYKWDTEKKELKKIEQKSVELSADDLPEFESYLCLMFQKFRTKGVCTNGEIIDFVKEHSQKLKNTLCHPWSKEDEQNYDIILKIICSSNKSENLVNELFNWFKSLKNRILPRPKQEWSYEDKIHLGNCIALIQRLSEREANWLKSLRPQNNNITNEELVQAKKNAYNDALDKIEYHSEEPTFDDGWNAAIWYLKKRNIQLCHTWKPSDEQITWLYRAADDASKDSRMKQILNELLFDLKKLREE